MRKTSVYLPEPLKRKLAANARTTQRSEAEVIRGAVEMAVEAGIGPTSMQGAAADPPTPGRLVGVGVGPGAPDLLTVRALRAVRRAHRVVAPCTAVDAIGRAEATLREAAPDVAVERLEFVMAPAPGQRSDALNRACDRVAAWLQAGEEVAFITLGDPNVYSTFSSVAAGVRVRWPGVRVETVPGIMAFQELAARSGTVLTDEQQSLVVLPANGDDRPLEASLQDDHSTVVVYKGGGRIAQVAERLQAAGRLSTAVLGELLGMPGERITGVAQAADRPASYLSAVIVPARRGGGAVPERAGRAARAEPKVAEQGGPRPKVAEQGGRLPERAGRAARAEPEPTPGGAR